MGKKPGPDGAQLNEMLDLLGSYFTIRPASRADFVHFFSQLQLGITPRLELMHTTGGALEIAYFRD